MKAAIWKWLILVVVTAWSVALITPPKEKIKLGLDLQGGTSYTLEIDDTAGLVGSVSDARDRAVEVVRNRVDSMGVAEPTIYPDGERRIIVQIPGMKAEDRERASANIRKAAFLEFRMVHPKNDDLIRNLFADRKVPDGYEAVVIPGRAQGDAWVRKGPPPTEAERAALRRFEEKAGYDLLLEKVTEQGRDYFVPHYVSRKAELTGDALKSANVDYQQFGQRVVQISFDARGRKKFAQLTADHAPGGVKNPDPNGRHYLGIVLDNTLYSAPFIRTSIPGGEAIIEGNFSLEEARDLALVLRAGALPAPLRVIEERSVDPTLGVDSIQSGWRAAGLGFVAVALFMVLYYRFAGLVAVLALVFNLVLLPLGMIITAGFFSLIGGGGGLGSSGVQLPVLTLPGIAGTVLTVGMAVDANVLIFERIREEMRLGKRFGAAISAGYDKAFSTIFDSNLTTLLTAIILFWMGSGPVKGFAVTLTAGIIASMYTAIVGTRMVFDFLEGHGYLNHLTMSQWVKETKVDFMSHRWVAGILSLVVIAGSLTVAGFRGRANFGVDFTGGQQLTLTFTQKAEVDTLRAALAGAGLTDVGIQYQRSGTTEKQNEVLALKVGGPEAGAQAQQILAEQFADSHFKLLQEDTVGPQVGRELQRSGLIAIGLSLVGMILYITIRFEFSFAVGAVAGLLHSLLITIGLYCVFQRQFSTTTIAALLTVLGYSVNDTIVVFDRIRETRKLRAGRLDAGIVNESVNATLSRTLLTSLTTLLSVVMLLVFGGGAIFDFALALFIGVVAGTYSSIFIASPIMLAVRPRVALAPTGK